MPSDHRGRGRGGSRHNSQPRTVQVSKALSRLLRHAAEQERIPIDNHGYIRMDHLLRWQKLQSMKPPVTFEEVVDVVEDNEKKRFALKYVPRDPATDAGTPSVDTLAISETPGEPTAEAEVESDTQRAIEMFRSTMGDSDPKRFFIRATQGHSMKTIDAENLLTPISLDEPKSIPDTVVHGTFYGAWAPILQTGGLQSMTRNHVHFATGPSLDDALPSTPPAELQQQRQNGGLAKLLGENKVVSGMRSDAQILIYVDIRKALQEEKEMKWWRSENGVILTDGIAPEDGAVKTVPTRFWLAAVEVKEGVGLLWKQGQGDNGVVKELPETLRNRGVPRGKGAGGSRGRGGGRGRGRGGEGERRAENQSG